MLSMMTFHLALPRILIKAPCESCIELAARASNKKGKSRWKISYNLQSHREQHRHCVGLCVEHDGRLDVLRICSDARYLELFTLLTDI